MQTLRVIRRGLIPRELAARLERRVKDLSTYRVTPPIKTPRLTRTIILPRLANISPKDP